jgi:hypothetical protein
MKYFQEINFPNFEQSNNEIQTYFNYLYPDKNNIKNFFNFPPKAVFVKMCPTVLKGFEELELNFKSIFMIGVVFNNNKSIHIDNSPRPCRLQWPVFNSQSVETIWYTADPNDRTTVILPNRVPYTSYQPEDCKEIARTCIVRPTVIRVEEPHAVDRTSDNPKDFPRAAFSFVFKETLENFLQ